MSQLWNHYPYDPALETPQEPTPEVPQDAPPVTPAPEA